MQARDKGKEGREGGNSKVGINASRKGCRRGKEGPARRGNLRGAASRLSRTLEGVVGACGAACLEGWFWGVCVWMTVHKGSGHREGHP